MDTVQPAYARRLRAMRASNDQWYAIARMNYLGEEAKRARTAEAAAMSPVRTEETSAKRTRRDI